MRVDVGSRGGTREMRIEMAALCREYAAKLSLPDDIIIDIRLVKRVRRNRGDGGMRVPGPIVGSAMSSIDDPRLFLVRIRVDNDMPATLMHELAHIAQFASKRLVYKRVVHAVWEGRDLGPLSKINYDTAPWEIEARKLEKDA